MNIFEKIRFFFSNPSYPRTLALVGLLIITIAIPITVTVLGQTTHIFQFAAYNRGGPTPTPTPPPPPKCPSNAPRGSFCTGAGFCRTNAQNYYISANCGGGQVCCSPKPTPQVAQKVTYTCSLTDPTHKKIVSSTGEQTIPCSQNFICKGSYTSIGSDLTGATSYLCKASCSSNGGVCVGSGNPPQTSGGNNQYNPTVTYANTDCAGQIISNGTCPTYTVCCPRSDVIQAIDSGIACLGPNNEKGTCWFNEVTSNTISPIAPFINTSPIFVAPYGEHILYQTTKGGHGICGTSASLPYLMPQGTPVVCLGKPKPPSPCGAITSTPNGKGTPKAFCEKYQCQTGETSISGTCPFADSVCCTTGPSTFSCINPNDPNYSAFQGTDGSVTYCDSGQACVTEHYSASHSGYITSGGPSVAKKNLCATFDPNTCKCTNKTSFACGAVQRTCGKGMVCSNNNVCAQAGLWPCIYDCPNFNGDDQLMPNGCSDGISLYAPNCPYPNNYVAQNIVNGAFSCQYKGPITSSPSKSCQKTPSVTNYCQYATNGNGGYCGSVLGANPNHVYDCTNQQTTKDTDCGSNGCVVNANGSDYCKGNSGGGGGVSCTPIRTYNECETGAATYCLSHGVPKGHIANVTQTSCGYSCKDAGPCSCTNGKDTKFAISLSLPGIGTGQYDNTNPAHPNRTANVRVFDVSNPNGSINGSSQSFNFGKSNGKFDGATIDIGNNLSCGATYKVEVHLPGYLPATANVTYGDSSQVITINPLPGDINMVDSNGVIIGDGKIDINDYSIYRQCRNVDPNTPITFKSNTTTVQVTCSTLINFYDFQDGGTMENVPFPPSGIGEWDANYNLWLRSYLTANGF